MKRERDESEAIASENHGGRDSLPDSQPSPTPSPKRVRSVYDGADTQIEAEAESEAGNEQTQALLEDAASQSAVTLQALDSGDVDVENAMTQVDKRWSQHRRRRSFDKMTQAPGANKDAAGIAPEDESPSEAGIIEKLELHNFMCHSAFSLTFGPQTNFIIGRNGSGKSAVLTGISVALGAKASDTDRGNSLKNLIMHGKNVARATVTIRNKGPEAYMPEEFGDKIIVERVLRNDRPHSLTIKNADNKTISTAKKTIDRILEYFGITIANPMTILTQTEAKTFLAHSSDKDKFNSFMAGTRLKESFDNIKKTQDDANEIKDILDKNKDVFEEAKQKFNEARKVWVSFKDADEYIKKKEVLIGKKIWLEHSENLKKYNQAEEMLNKKQSTISSKESQRQQIMQDIHDIQKKKDEMENGELTQHLDKFNHCKQEVDEMKSFIGTAKDELDDIKRKIATYQREIEENDKLLKTLNANIAAEQKRIESSSEENIDKLRAFKEKQEERKAVLSNERDQLYQQVELIKLELNNHENDARNSMKGINGEIRQMESNIKEAQHQDNSNRPENSFQPNMNNMMRDLANHKFKAPVMGPLGMHIELKKDCTRWGSVLESILQRTLTSFIVTNHKDAQELGRKVKFFNTGSEITVRQPEVFDYSQYIPHSKYPSVLDVLKVNDESLKCFLVDSMKLHSTLLVPNRMDAQRELENDHQNLISSVFCFVDQNVLRIYKKNGSFQSDPVHVNNHYAQARLRIEGDSMLMRLQREMQDLRRSRDEKHKKFEDKRQVLVKDLEDANRRVKTVSREISGTTQSISKTDEKLEKMAGGTSKLETYMDEKDRITTEIGILVQKVEPLHNESSRASSAIAEQLELYKSIHEDYTSALNVYRTKVKESEGFISNITFNKSNIVTLDNEINTLYQHVEKLRNYRAQTERTMAELAEQASEFCLAADADLTPEMTKSSIDNQIKVIDDYLAEIEKRQGITKEKAGQNLLKGNHNLKEVERKFTDTIHMYNELHNALEKRLNNLVQTTYLTFQEVESVFISALKIRRFRGKIEFNIKKGTLTLKVATNETGPLRSVESFSGGEKSYGQIAFLFAIWGPMHSRVRGLDEFDVFMDQINRRVALKLILSKVAENPKRQTIFITPLSISGIEGLDSKTVHIHEISPPERANL
jgi:structural maintenance of chromosomes protein 6